MYAVKDKVFLVTGGASGIGAGFTKSVLAEGAKHVAILDVDDVNGTALKTELTTKYGAKRIKFYKCDVTTKDLDDCIDTVVKEVGYIDCVVNCACIANDGPLFEKEIEINFTALVRSSMKAYNLMRKDHGGKGGAIVNISSICGLYLCNCVPIFAATKGAVLLFSNCMGMEPYYSRSGVRVITICFGVTDTKLVESAKYTPIAIDKETNEEHLVLHAINEFPIQKVESAVAGLVEAYKRGKSASTWLISAGKPAQDITGNVVEGYDVFSRGIRDA